MDLEQHRIEGYKNENHSHMLVEHGVYLYEPINYHIIPKSEMVDKNGNPISFEEAHDRYVDQEMRKQGITDYAHFNDGSSFWIPYRLTPEERQQFDKDIRVAARHVLKKYGIKPFKQKSK